MRKATPKRQNKGLIPSMIHKTEKEKGFIYRLSNGDFLYFEDKIFPTDKVENKSNPAQLNLFFN
ncbi:hypothetical protein [Flavobacterium sp. RSSB_23]|uniref:hypothetical protein n=1 Tax=Flavobacterium sp. RSSB_23 TaxID=3447668 RepID=UPI003F374799